MDGKDGSTMAKERRNVGKRVGSKAKLKVEANEIDVNHIDAAHRAAADAERAIGAIFSDPWHERLRSGLGTAEVDAEIAREVEERLPSYVASTRAAAAERAHARGEHFDLDSPPIDFAVHMMRRDLSLLLRVEHVREHFARQPPDRVRDVANRVCEGIVGLVDARRRADEVPSAVRDLFTIGGTQVQGVLVSTVHVYESMHAALLHPLPNATLCMVDRAMRYIADPHEVEDKPLIDRIEALSDLLFGRDPAHALASLALFAAPELPWEKLSLPQSGWLTLRTRLDIEKVKAKAWMGALSRSANLGEAVTLDPTDEEKAAWRAKFAGVANCNWNEGAKHLWRRLSIARRQGIVSFNGKQAAGMDNTEQKCKRQPSGSQRGRRKCLVDAGILHRVGNNNFTLVDPLPDWFLDELDGLEARSRKAMGGVN